MTKDYLLLFHPESGVFEQGRLQRILNTNDNRIIFLLKLKKTNNEFLYQLTVLFCLARYLFMKQNLFYVYVTAKNLNEDIVFFF